VQDSGRLQRIPYSVPPHLLLRLLLRLRGVSFCPVHFEIAALWPLCCTIRPVYEAPAELGVHLVQLPQCLRVQVDGDGLEGDQDDIMHAHLDGRVSPLRVVRGECVQDVGEGLQRKRRGVDLERRVRAGGG
jgi:hypothetical protein